MSSLPVCRAADFEREVAPVLIRRCLECHKGAEPSGKLSLESGDGLLAGGESGPAVSPGNPAESYLLDRVVGGEMPPPVKGVPQSLPPAERKVLQDWIAEGAKWPAGRTLDLYEITTDVRGGRDWWSFQPVTRPIVPDVQNTAAVANPIDAFIVARLERDGFQPAPTADARTVVRRMFHDVIGLPPSFEELQTWTNRLQTGSSSHHHDVSDTALKKLADHLLASPHFGERWARYWLDLVRYAETSGYERDQPKPFAWKYRDWVVSAINDDMPADRFIRHQLAGDEIPERDEQSVIATGFLRLGTWNDEPNDDADYRYERLEDMVHATSSAFLGLTVKCARCHDHKFDPIPQDDYYRMASSFWPGPIVARDRKLLGGPSSEELGVENVLGWTDLSASPPPLHVLKNGESDKPLYPIEPATLTFAESLFRKFDVPEQQAKTTGRRRQLADWIVSPQNPLTARVFVNRLWLHHFGEGLVRSPNNFGYKGELPTHPELLDWLTSEFIDSGWSARHVHGLILSSRTWRQSSSPPWFDVYAELDSSNRHWWRASRRRMDSETLRDALLTVSGEIDLRVGGEGFKPTISAEALEGFSRKEAAYQAAPAEQQHRRSLYIFVSRSLMPPMMAAFDQCDTTLPCGQRDVTTVAPQALAMLNNPFIHRRSEVLATRVAAEEADVDGQITLTWERVLGRAPEDQERQQARLHLERQQERFTLADAASADQLALASLCHVLLNSNEFLYID
ncbi:MAG: PSD1 and planctomycete cytochrome C domain-containing protein [Fuerstiella sp.]